MNTKTLRRPYAAPNAELISLAPEAPIANSWTWGTTDNNKKWDNNKWGATFTASATGFAEWADDEGLND